MKSNLENCKKAIEMMQELMKLREEMEMNDEEEQEIEETQRCSMKKTK